MEYCDSRRKMLLKNFLGRFCIGLVLSTLHLSGPTIAGDHHQKQLGADADNEVRGGDASSADDVVQGEKTAFACQGTRLHLQCQQPDEVIKVTRANYGRFSIAVCNDKSMTSWSVNCYSPRAKDVFENNCNNFGQCDISAEDFDFGPNPCPDTERYLEASYVCVPSDSDGSWPSRIENGRRNSLNTARRKPLRRVPITAPPPTTTTGATSTSSSTTSTTNAVMNTTSSPVSSSSSTSGLLPPQSRRPKLKAEDTPVFYETTTSSSSSSNSDLMCEAIHHRGILWPSTPAGSMAVQPCIKGTAASWQCTSRGQWASSADLSSCQSKNWPLVTQADLEKQPLGFDINLFYGGDILAILNRLMAFTQADQFPASVRALLRTLSSLLDPRYQKAWADLSNIEEALRRFMEVTEALILMRPPVDFYSTPNIYCQTAKSVKGGGLLLQAKSLPMTAASNNQNQSLIDEFKERSLDSAAAGSSTVAIQLNEDEPQDVVFVVISYYGLHQLLSGKKTVDPVISLTSSSLPAFQAESTISLPKANMDCYPLFNSRCSVIKNQTGFRQCQCSGLATLAFRIDEDFKEADSNVEELQSATGGNGEVPQVSTTTMVVIVAISASLLVATLLSAALLVIYCRRVKIQDSKNNWENNSLDGAGQSSNPDSETLPSASWRSKNSTASNTTTSSSLLLGTGGHYQQPQHVMNGGSNTPASIIPYESSHFHAGLSSQPQKNNQASGTWRRLLSSIFPTNARTGRRRPPTRPHLTLGHYHHHHHRLNAENTLRLEAHRQLFQFDYHMQHQDNDHSRVGGGHHETRGQRPAPTTREAQFQFYASECPTPPNPRVLQHHQQSNIWNEDIYQVPLEDHAKIFHHQPQQRPLFNGDSSYIRTGQRRSRHCSSGKSPMDLPWQLQNKFQQDQEGQEESLLTRNTLGGNYKPMPQSSRPNSQHIYVDLDSSTSSTFSSSNGIGASVEHHHHQRPHCHDSFVVSQC